MIKLMIVDDEFWARNTIKSFIQDKHPGLVLAGEAENGIEAIKLIKEVNPDIIITDMKMPGADGTSLLRELEISYPQIRSIVVSGYSDFEYTKQAIKSKVQEYILKPVDMDELNNAVHKCIEDIHEERRKGSPFFYEPIQSENIGLLSVLLKYKTDIRSFLLELKPNELKKTLRKCFAEISESGNIGPRELKIIYSEFLMIIEEHFIKNNYDLREILKNIEVFSKPGEETSPAEELFSRLENIFEIAVIDLENRRNKGSKGALYDIKEYIDKKYSMDISLQKLAGMFFVSKEYLSKAFKNEFGVNLTNYITELRMEKAKDMICNTNISFINIAHSVGYEDLQYFYKVFRNYAGISPGQLRIEQEKKG